MQVLTNPTPLQVREQFVDMIHRELVGPAGGEHERVYEGSIRERYAIGIVAPRNATMPETPIDEQGQLAVDGDDTSEEGFTDAEINAPDTPNEEADASGSTFMPTSIGLTVVVDNAYDEIRITVKWGHYKREKDERDDKTILYWQRIPKEHTIVTKVADIHNNRWYPDPDNKLIYVQGKIRIYEDASSISLFLVNGQKEQSINKGETWLFQPEIIVDAPDEQAIFIKRQMPIHLNPKEPEDMMMQMMYRRQREFAVGHGVATHAELHNNEWERAYHICTSVMPKQEVERMNPPPLEDLVVDMAQLSETKRGEFSALLMPLLDAYGDWIERQSALIEQRPEDLDPFVEMGIPQWAKDEWREAYQRIQAGIEVLDSNEDAAEAFRFANRAMWLQRIRSIFSAEVRQNKAPNLNDIDILKNRSWRPFQIAFILLNVSAMTDPTHPERSSTEPGAEPYTDLLWFPTGGGKTEAYLGLAAFTIGIRRLQGVVGDYSGEAGVTVLMRYTLRLLTLQQFQRAAALIAACEVIRREAPHKWGNEPFRIGLWVGRRSTPNWTDESAEAVKLDHGHGWEYGGSVGGRGTPVQLTNCPWCGSSIDPGKNIRVETYDQGRGRTFQYCGDALGECPFSYRKSPDEGLPIVVVDEEIYRRLPTLLIATVDKFAQMPWKGETQMLFGRVSGYCPRHGFVSPEINDKESHRKKRKLPAVKLEDVPKLRPPDLIIQDELHLISGPLGTLVGLYETAIDALSTWHIDGQVIRPKVVASTATIRRARDQVNSLFSHRVKIFPPSGLSSDDNFFSKQAPSSDASPSRMYLGICATGTRFKTIMIRVYVAAMAAAQKLLETYGTEYADPYMTLVGYFNSMRELGGMRRVMDDAVRTRLQVMSDRGLTRRFINSFDIDELTSRKGAVEIPRILDRLETPFETPVEGKKRKKNKQYPFDAVLATNMISVGVDVRRLGLMVVASQPKRTAEYIQATSRVGRAFPGVVLTVYNWARPRDVSHYERFEHYHATFYQQVEALSVTPFAKRALDRGLTGVFVAYLRLADEILNQNGSAGNITDYQAYVDLAKDIISERAERITGDQSIAEIVQYMLQQRIDDWRSKARNATAVIGYQAQRDDKTIALLNKPTEEDWTIFTCLNSLREVEPKIRLIHNDYGMDRDIHEQTQSDTVEDSSND